jgi:DNA repair protein RecO
MQNLDEGFIIRQVDFKDNDKILTIFTKEGKLSVIAKGGRSGKRSTLLDLANYIEFQTIKSKGGLDIVTTISMKNSFHLSKEKFSLYIFYPLEILSKIDRVGQDESQLFDLLNFTLSNLYKTPDLYISVFNIKTLLYEGLLSDFTNCFICSKPLVPSIQNIASISGISHIGCNLGEYNIRGYPISVDAIKIIRYIKNTNLNISNFKFDIPEKALKEILLFSTKLLESSFDVNLSSKKYIV